MTRVTMCIVFYNHEEFVYDALEGAVNQSYENYDLIIRDDASTDRTQDLIREYFSKNEFAKGDLILDLATQNEGLIRSLNRILMLSRNEIIVSQSGDDISLPDRIRKSVALLEKYDVDLVSCDAMIINSEGSIVAESWFEQTKGPMYRLLMSTDGGQITIRDPNDLELYSTVLPGFGFTYRKRLFLDMKLPDHITYEDYYMTFLAFMNRGAIVIKDVLVCYRRHSDNMSKKYFKTQEAFRFYQSNWLRKKIDVVRAQLEYMQIAKMNQNNNNVGRIWRFLEMNLSLLRFNLAIFTHEKVHNRIKLLSSMVKISDISIKRKLYFLYGFIFPEKFIRRAFAKSNKINAFES